MLYAECRDFEKRNNPWDNRVHDMFWVGSLGKFPSTAFSGMIVSPNYSSGELVIKWS